jgi:hypothetical protein
MNTAFQCFIVVAVMLGMFLFFTLGLRLIAKKSLYNFQGLLLASLLIGTVFSIASFILILISKKFQYWSFSSKLIYAGEIFLWAFVGSLILIPIAFRRAQDYVRERNDKKRLEEP